LLPEHRLGIARRAWAAALRHELLILLGEIALGLLERHIRLVDLAEDALALLRFELGLVVPVVEQVAPQLLTHLIKRFVLARDGHVLRVVYLSGVVHRPGQRVSCRAAQLLRLRQRFLGVAEEAVRNEVRIRL
jgi:hypothetical protein